MGNIVWEFVLALFGVWRCGGGTASCETVVPGVFEWLYITMCPPCVGWVSSSFFGLVGFVVWVVFFRKYTKLKLENKHFVGFLTQSYILGVSCARVFVFFIVKCIFFSSSSCIYGVKFVTCKRKQ